MKLLYFAWVREKVGKSEEDVSLPENVTTIDELINWLESRGPEYTAAFKDRTLIKTAIDQTHVSVETPLGTAREIAFFPPVTGG